jgi:hypothetical protein
MRFFAPIGMPHNGELLWVTIENDSECRSASFACEFDPGIAKVRNLHPDNTSKVNLWKLTQTLKKSYAQHCQPSIGP